MEAPDLTLLSTQFVKFGGNIFRKHVNTFDAAAQGVLVYKNVKAPIALTKLSAQGGPQPYRAADDTTGNGAEFEDRLLTVYQSKWDFDIDPEKYRNTYLALADESAVPFYQHILDQVSKEYLAAINDNTAYLGVRNGAGTTAADLADGWGTIIAAQIIAANITPIVTGAITNVNAVDKVNLVATKVPVWMRKMGFRVKCSYDVFDKYAQAYATAFGFQFIADAIGRYRINNANAYLEPESWMGTSQRLIAVPDNNLSMGTDGEGIGVHPSIRRNIIELRLMMPIGFQIQDLDAVVVNDQA